MKYIFINNKKYLMIAIIILFVTFGIYEIIISVYLVFVCALMLVLLITNKQKTTFRQLIVIGIKFIIPVVAAVILKYLVGNLLLLILGIAPSTRAATGNMWGSMPLISVIRSLFIDLVIVYILSSFNYLPVLVFDICVFCMFIVSLRYCINKKTIIPFLLFLGMIISAFSLSFIQGWALLYRHAIGLNVFCGFSVMMLAYSVKAVKWGRVLINSLVILLVLVQSHDLNQWFYLSKMRYDYDQNILLDVGQDLYYQGAKGKTVLFVGYVSLPEYIKNYTPTDLSGLEPVRNLVKFIAPDKIDKILDDVMTNRPNRNNAKWSLLSWSVDAFDEVNTEFLKLMAINGYDFLQGSEEEYMLAEEEALNLPVWPAEGSIKDMGDFYVVNMGFTGDEGLNGVMTNYGESNEEQ